ncbi:MAG: DUF2279 domain-containing protein [Chitinophagaceae bacterium]
MIQPSISYLSQLRIQPLYQMRLPSWQKKIPISIFLLLISFFTTPQSYGQDTVKVKTYRMADVDTITTTQSTSDSLKYGKFYPDTTPAVNFKNRQRLVAVTSIGLYTGALVALNQAWYANYKRSSFHTFNDNKEWLQVDKVGHAWSAYQLSRLSYGAWKWAGVSEKKAVLYAGLSGPGFLTVIEILDGFSSEWGWSWGDMGANVFGGGLFVAQQLGWHEQRIDFKFSVHKNNYADTQLTRRANNLFGSSLPERFLKDYNAQTYWLSANLKSFFKQSNLPAWLNVAMGYGANGMFGAFENVGKDGSGNTTFNRQDIKRYRQWFLSPDIKWSKIKTSCKFLRTVFYVLDGIKFPLPGLELSQGKLQLRGLLF